MNQPKKVQGLSQADYDFLFDKITAPKMYRLADVKDRIEKIAFDVVRFRDTDGLDKLWLIEEHDGEKFIVAQYEDDEGEVQKSSSHWNVIPDKVGNINIFYKQEPVVKMALASIGIAVEDTSTLCRFLPDKLASDNSMVSLLLGEMSPNDRAFFINKFPELKNESFK